MVFSHSSSYDMPSIPYLRTPDDCFLDLPGYPWQAAYTDKLPALDGLRMHYLDEGPRNAPVTWLCLHGNPAWSYLYRRMIPIFLAAGHRVIAPDLPGFGKSDKPMVMQQHTFSWHRQVLLEFVEELNLKNINLVVQDWGGLLGLTLPMEAPTRYRGLLMMNTYLATAEATLPDGFVEWRNMCRNRPDFSIGRLFSRGNPHLTAAECAAYDAPFPDPSYRAGTLAFPEMLPNHMGADGVDVSRRAKHFWAHGWTGCAMMAIGEKDPVFTPQVMEELRSGISNCSEPLRIAEGGHFVQEFGEEIAAEALKRLSNRASEI